MLSTRFISLRIASVAGARFYAVAKKSGLKKKSTTKSAGSAALREAKNVTKETLKANVDYHQEALELANAGKFEDAFKSFKLALKETPNDPTLHANMGAVAIDAGLPDLAEQSLSKAYQLLPDDPTIIFHLSRALQAKASQYPDSKDRDPLLDRAVQLLKTGLKAEPMWPEAYADLGMITQARGDAGKALGYFEKTINVVDTMIQAMEKAAKAKPTKKSRHAPKMSPEMAYRLNLARKTALVGMSEVYTNIGDPVKAIQSLKLAAQSDRQDVEIIARIGECYANQLKKPRRALMYYKECLRLQPESAMAHKLMGQLYANPDFSGFDLEKASRCFQTALRFKPTPELFFHLGWVNIQLGDVERGKECLERVRKLDKDPERIVHATALLGDVELIQETPENAAKALKLFQDALNVANKYNATAPNIRISMAKCYILLGETRKALESLQYIMDSDNKNADALTLLAEILFMEGREEDAISVVRQALKLSPRSNQLNFWFGRYLFRNSDAGPEKTMKYLSKAIAGIADPLPVGLLEKVQAGEVKTPENFAMPPPFAGEAHLMLGLLFEGNEQHSEALDHYQMAAAYDSESPVVHLRVGTMLEALNRNSEAQEAFRRASVLDPESVEANFLLGNSFAEGEQFEQALLYYQKAAGNTASKPEEATTDLLFRLYSNMATAHKRLLQLTKEPVHEQQAREFLKLANQYGHAKMDD